MTANRFCRKLDLLINLFDSNEVPENSNCFLLMHLDEGFLFQASFPELNGVVLPRK